MHDAKDEAFWNRDVKIELPVLSLMALHGSVCLALRHPQNTGASRKMMVKFVKQAGEYLVDLGALTPDELISIEKIEAKETARLRKGMEEAMKDPSEFIHGIVAALDVVAIFDNPTMFKEIVETAGVKDVLKEIRKNGLERTKAMAIQEFGNKPL